MAAEPAGGSPRQRRLDAVARRDTILAAATPLFAAHGYEQTRVADVAAAVGVTEPVVFQHFRTKANLFSAVVDRLSADLDATVAGLAADGGNVLALVGALLSAEHLDRLHDRGGLGALLRDAGAHADEEVRRASARAASRAARAVADLLRRGQADGSVRRDVEAEALAWLALSLVRAREFRRAHDGPTSGRLEADLLAAVLETLRPRPDR